MRRWSHETQISEVCEVKFSFEVTEHAVRMVFGAKIKITSRSEPTPVMEVLSGEIAHANSSHHVYFRIICRPIFGIAWRAGERRPERERADAALGARSRDGPSAGRPRKERAKRFGNLRPRRVHGNYNV